MVKTSIAVGVLLMGISSCYYFIFALPKIQRERSAVENEQTQERVKSMRWERDQQCSSMAARFFKGTEWEPHGWYESHFNHKLNRCFILVKSITTTQHSLSKYRALMDVSDGTQLAQFDKEVPFGLADYAVKPILCDISDKHCDTEEQFDNFVKTYTSD